MKSKQDKPLNNEEKATNLETMKHIGTVGYFINIVIKELLTRAEEHDKSKLIAPEVSWFTEYTPKLANCEYGSSEYNEFLKELKVALEHHYANNSHHPEHYENGVNGMNLIDVIEMFCDWRAATLRHRRGDLSNSIKVNADRFNLDEQLVSIFNNTVKLFESK